jgi:chemotaxis signal transduction protein
MTETTTDIKNASQGKSEELLQLVSFNIGDEEFGVDEE